MYSSQSKTATITGVGMVDAGQSRRLQAFREKAGISGLARNDRSMDESHAIEPGLAKLSQELMLARQLIDQRLAEIMSSLPHGRQKTLFKIRFGVDIDLIRELPVKRVMDLLKIQPAASNQPLLNMKRLGDMNYNGELIVSPASLKADTRQTESPF